MNHSFKETILLRSLGLGSYGASPNRMIPVCCIVSPSPPVRLQGHASENLISSSSWCGTAQRRSPTADSIFAEIFKPKLIQIDIDIDIDRDVAIVLVMIYRQ